MKVDLSRPFDELLDEFFKAGVLTDVECYRLSQANKATVRATLETLSTAIRLTPEQIESIKYHNAKEIYVAGTPLQEVLELRSKYK